MNLKNGTINIIVALYFLIHPLFTISFIPRLTFSFFGRSKLPNFMNLFIALKMVDLKNGTTEHYQNIVMCFVDSSGWSLQNSLKFELLKSFSLQPVVSRNGRNQFAIRQADKFVSTDPDIGAYYPSWCQAAVSRVRVRVPNYAYREKARGLPPPPTSFRVSRRADWTPSEKSRAFRKLPRVSKKRFFLPVVFLVARKRATSNKTASTSSYPRRFA